MSNSPRSFIGNILDPRAMAVPLLLAGCLSPRAGQEESSTSVELTGESGGGSTWGEASGTTMGDIMTTTEDPDDDGSSSDGPVETTGPDGDTTSGSSTGNGTTTDIPPNCGDGVVQEPEQCDDGEDNDDNAKCTKNCHNATCGDGLLHTGVEVCDDGVNDGSYNGCMAGCMELGPYCGDFEVDPEEECDAAVPSNGCVKNTCKHAHSCLELKDAWGEDAHDGIFPLWPKVGVMLDAYCDMTTDGGGYTFVKIGAGQLTPAKSAEAQCGMLGLQLLVPRTAGHLTSAAAVAFNDGFTPKIGQNPDDPTAYLLIFGIYPKNLNDSCVGVPFNSELCVEWRASDGQAFWISGTGLQGQPGLNFSCLECSMLYGWNGQTLVDYATLGGNNGGTSTHFMCDVGDKRPMN